MQKVTTYTGKGANKLFFKIEFTYSALMVLQVKTLPARRWNPTGKYWTCPASPQSFDKLEKWGFTFDKEAKQFAKNIKSKPTNEYDEISVPGLDDILFPFQKQGIAFLEANNGRGLIADEMGLGKTIQSLGYLKLHPELRPAIIVTPASLKLNWAKEISKWIKETCEILTGQKPYYFENDIIIINYDILDYWIDTIKKKDIEIVITDECHYYKNKKAKRTKAVKKLSRMCDKFIALSGTPIVNRPIEAFNVINILQPNLFPDWWHFVQRYCAAKSGPFGWDFSGASHTDELHNILTTSIMIRRKKEDVMKDLPPKVRSVVPMDINNRNEYFAAKDDFLHWLLENEGKEKADKAAGAETLAKIEKLKQIAVKGKIKYCINWIQDFIDNDEKLVVFCTHHKTIDALMSEFEGIAVKLDGRDSLEKKQKAVDVFQKCDKIKLFIGNIKAAGTGITLTEASSTCFIELGWTPGDHDQAEDRCLLGNQLVFCPQMCYNDSMSIKTIAEIEIGDNVLTHTGRISKVINKQKRTYLGRMTSIKYVGWAEPIECTFDHRFLIVSKNGGILKWEEAHKILPSDCLVFPKMIEEIDLKEVKIKDEWRLFPEKSNICKEKDCLDSVLARGLCSSHYQKWKRKTPIDKREVSIPPTNGRYVRLPDIIEIDDEWLFVFGWYVAEGFSSIIKGKGKFVSLAGHEKEEEILKRCGRVFERLGIKWTITKQKGTKAIELRAYSGELAYWFRDWFGHGAKNKSLPKVIMDLPKDKAKIVLDAYIMGDGYFRNNNYEWVSASRELAYQFCILATKCGYPPTLRRSSVQSGRHFVGSYNENNYTDKPYVLRKVRRVESYYEKRPFVYDLTIEHDESFVVGFASAHNCHRIGQEADSVNAYYLLADNTIEMDIAALIDKKRKVLSQVLDGKESSEIEMLTELMAKIKGE